MQINKHTKILEYILVGAIMSLLSIFAYYDASYDLTSTHNATSSGSLLAACCLLIFYYYIKERGIL